MRLPVSRFGALFVIGAVVTPFGDHGHIASGTTEYIARGGPFIWDTSIWFPLLVGIATVVLAEMRLRLGAPRSGLSWRDGLGAVAAMMALYAVTALVRHQPLGPATLLVASLVALLTAVIGDRASAICGLAAGAGGTVIEIALIAAKQFRYADDIGVFLTVAPWTPPLYFAFGVVAARLGEVAACGAAPGHELER
jgi:hypothetical protein